MAFSLKDGVAYCQRTKDTWGTYTKRSSFDLYIQTNRELTTGTLRKFDHAIIAKQDSGLVSYRKLADLRVQVGGGLEVKDSMAVGDFAAGIRKAAGT